jgi:hypothetical protein
MPKAKTARTKNRIYLRGEKIWLYEEMEVKKKKKKNWEVLKCDTSKNGQSTNGSCL